MAMPIPTLRIMVFMIGSPLCVNGLTADGRSPSVVCGRCFYYKYLATAIAPSADIRSMKSSRCTFIKKTCKLFICAICSMLGRSADAISAPSASILFCVGPKTPAPIPKEIIPAIAPNVKASPGPVDQIQLMPVPMKRREYSNAPRTR